MEQNVNGMATVTANNQESKKTYSEIADLRYKVKNPELRDKANRYGIIEAVRDLRMTLVGGGLIKDVIYWQHVLTGSEDGAIVWEVWQWLFGCYPTFITQHDRETGALLNAWVAEN